MLVGHLKLQVKQQQRDGIQYLVLVEAADTIRQQYAASLQRYKEICIAGALGTRTLTGVIGRGRDE